MSARTLVYGPLLFVATSPIPLIAQDASAELRGLVRAAETEEILVGAQVLLPALEIGVQTNEEGRFRLRELPPGIHALEVRYLGRASGTVEAVLRAGQVTSLELALEIEPVEVAELRVEVERRWRGKMAGFYERMERGGGGRFITREHIEATRGSRLHQVFRRVPSLKVVQCTDVPGVGSTAIGCYGLLSGRAMLSFRDGNRPCPPEYYLDGARVPLNSLPLGVNEISPHVVEGIEVYMGSAAVPVQYAANARCGVVLIWTR